MDKNIQILKEEFPDLLGTSDLRRSDLPDGWLSIVRKFLYNIENMLMKKDQQYFSVRQIKEKLGGLRIYTTIPEEIKNYKDLIDTEVITATIKASSTCEICGENGILREGSWIRTLCEDHKDGNKSV